MTPEERYQHALARLRGAPDASPGPDLAERMAWLMKHVDATILPRRLVLTDAGGATLAALVCGNRRLLQVQAPGAEPANAALADGDLARGADALAPLMTAWLKDADAPALRPQRLPQDHAFDILGLSAAQLFPVLCDQPDAAGHAPSVADLVALATRHGLPVTCLSGAASDQPAACEAGRLPALAKALLGEEKEAFMALTLAGGAELLVIARDASDTVAIRCPAGDLGALVDHWTLVD